MRGIHRIPVNFQHKGPVTRKLFPFDDVIMIKNIWYIAHHMKKTKYYWHLLQRYHISHVINQLCRTDVIYWKWCRSRFFCFLFATKASLDHILPLCQLDSLKRTSTKYKSKCIIFRSTKCIWKSCLQITVLNELTGEWRKRTKCQDNCRCRSIFNWRVVQLIVLSRSVAVLDRTHFVPSLLAKEGVAARHKWITH